MRTARRLGRTKFLLLLCALALCFTASAAFAAEVGVEIGNGNVGEIATGSGQNIEDAVTDALVNDGGTFFPNGTGEIITLFAYSVSTADPYSLDTDDTDDFDYLSTTLNAVTILDLRGVDVAGGEIPANAMKDNTALQIMALPANTKVIGASAFQDCTGLEDLYHTYWVETIGENAFNGCDVLAAVDGDPGVYNFPSVKYIGDNAFNGCTGLESFIATMLGSYPMMSGIGVGAFNGCTNLETLILGAGLPYHTTGQITDVPNLAVYTLNGDGAGDFSQAIYGTGATHEGYVLDSSNPVTLDPDSLSLTPGGDSVDVDINDTSPASWIAQQMILGRGLNGIDISWNLPSGIRVTPGSGLTAPEGNSRITFDWIYKIGITLGGAGGSINGAIKFSNDLRITIPPVGGGDDPVTPMPSDNPRLILKLEKPDFLQEGRFVGDDAWISAKVDLSNWSVTKIDKATIGETQAEANSNTYNGVTVTPAVGENGVPFIELSGTPISDGEMYVKATASVSNRGESSGKLTGYLKLIVREGTVSVFNAHTYEHVRTATEQMDTWSSNTNEEWGIPVGAVPAMGDELVVFTINALSTSNIIYSLFDPSRSEKEMKDMVDEIVSAIAEDVPDVPEEDQKAAVWNFIKFTDEIAAHISGLEAKLGVEILTDDLRKTLMNIVFEGLENGDDAGTIANACVPDIWKAVPWENIDWDALFADPMIRTLTQLQNPANWECELEGDNVVLTIPGSWSSLADMIKNALATLAADGPLSRAINPLEFEVLADGRIQVTFGLHPSALEIAMSRAAPSAETLLKDMSIYSLTFILPDGTILAQPLAGADGNPLPMNAIPRTKTPAPAPDPNPVPTGGGSSGGCNAGAGLFGSALCGAALIFATKRRK